MFCAGYDASGVGSEDGWKGLGAEPMHGTEVASLIAGHGHDTQGYSAIAGQPEADRCDCGSSDAKNPLPFAEYRYDQR